MEVIWLTEALLAGLKTVSKPPSGSGGLSWLFLSALGEFRHRFKNSTNIQV